MGVCLLVSGLNNKHIELKDKDLLAPLFVENIIFIEIFYSFSH